MQTAQQYLLNQAEHCRRAAEDSDDGETADALRRLATQFEQLAHVRIAAAARAHARI